MKTHTATRYGVRSRREQIGPQQYRVRYEILIWTTGGGSDPCVSGLRDTKEEALAAGRSLVLQKAQFGRGAGRFCELMR